MQLLPLSCVEKGAGLMITIEAILLKKIAEYVQSLTGT